MHSGKAEELLQNLPEGGARWKREFPGVICRAQVVFFKGSGENSCRMDDLRGPQLPYRRAARNPRQLPPRATFVSRTRAGFAASLLICGGFLSTFTPSIAQSPKAASSPVIQAAAPHAPETQTVIDRPSPDFPRPDSLPGSYLIKLRHNTRARSAQVWLDELGLDWAPLVPAKTAGFERQTNPDQEDGLDSWLRVQLTDLQRSQGFLQRLHHDPRVAVVEPNYRVSIAPLAPRVPRLLTDINPPPANPASPTIPGDFEFTHQWSLQNTGQESGKIGADIHAQAAWGLTTGSRTVRLAIIDTGIDYLHPDLSANIWRNEKEIPGNGIDDDLNGWIDDVHGYDFVTDDGDPLDDGIHGTHVAGIAGAVGDNGIGIAGVCWKVSLMAVKTFDESGGGTLAQVIQGIHYATANRAHIINASWGLPTRSRALEDAVRHARQHGVVFIAAAGNEGTETPFYPASMPEVLAIGATDRKDARATFSRAGANVDLAAPGDSILSTTPNNRFDILGGTSMAAPHVSGIAALVLSLHPEFTASQVETILKNSTDPIQSDRPIGNGRINALKSVQITAPLPELRLEVPETLAGVVDLRGHAYGPQFQEYWLELGSGENPTEWARIGGASRPVTNDVLLASWYSAAFRDGPYRLRLVGRNQNGQTSTESTKVEIRNVALLQPQNNDVLAFGGILPVLGNAFGTSVVYRIEYGIGRNPTQWESRGITLAHQGLQPLTNGLLAHWNTSGLDPAQTYALRITATVDGREGATDTLPVLFADHRLRPGFPVSIPIPDELPIEEWRHLVVHDLDGDGPQELIFVDPGNLDGRPAKLVVLDHQGQTRWTRELGAGEPLVDIPVLGDLDGDGRPEILAETGSPPRVHAFRFDGKPFSPNWPVPLPAGRSAKSMADLDGDGRMELVALTQQTSDQADAGPSWLVVIRADGTQAAAWEVPHCPIEADRPRSFPALGNMDDDALLEIVVPYGCGGIALFDLSETTGPIWKTRLGGAAIASPVLGDLDRDGHLEIVIGVHDPGAKISGGIYVLDRLGRIASGWPVLVRESFAGPVALADFDGDKNLEIAAASWSSRKIHLLQANGFEAPGWPRSTENEGSIKSGLTVADVDGDEKPDLIHVAPGSTPRAVRGGELEFLTTVRAWRFNGSPIDLHGAPEVAGLVMESSGGESRLKASGVIPTDLDGNGRLDLIAVSIQDALYGLGSAPAKLKRRSSLYAWELNVSFDPEFAPWPQWQGNPGHDGLYRVPPHRNRPPSLLPIPSQTIRPGGTFLTIPLDSFVEDRDHTPDQIRWSVETSPDVLATVSANRQLELRIRTSGWIGESSVSLVATDPAGSQARTTFHLAVRENYDPPIAGPDRIELDEDAAAEFSPTSNDRAPSGAPLEVIALSRAAHGRIESVAPGKYRYTPKTNFFGQDTALYTASDGRGGVVLASIHFEVRPLNDAPQANPDQSIVDEDQSTSIHPLANDLDADGDAIRLVESSKPQHGTLLAQASGFLYQPNANFHGEDVFEYTVADAAGLAATGRVSVLVRPVNDLPVAESQTIHLNRNTSTNIIFRAFDADGDTPDYEVLDGPAQGELFNFPTVAEYFPKKGFSGTDRFTYVAKDAKGTGKPATVNLIVLDTNNPPVASSRKLTTKINQSLAIKLNVSDADGDLPAIRIPKTVMHGRLTGEGTNWVYQPDTGFLGEDSFEFQASDLFSQSEIATVKLTVTDINTAPGAFDLRVSTRVNTATNLILDAFDPEGNPLTYTLLQQPKHGRLKGDPPDLIFTPDTDYVGPDRFTFKVSDGEFESAPGTVLVEVLAPNATPVAEDQTFSLVPDRPFRIKLQATDADGDPLIVPILKGPRHGRVFGTSIDFTYVPKSQFIGEDSFTYKAWDGTIYSREAKVRLVVNPPSQSPLLFDRIEATSGGGLQLFIRQEAGISAIVEESPDLIEWTELGKVSAPAPALVHPVPRREGATTRYFRLRKAE